MQQRDERDMTQLIATNNITAIVGLGLTGLSVARYLRGQDRAFIMLDTRQNPPMLDEFLREFPQQAIELGPLNPETLTAAVEIVVGPGMPVSEDSIAIAVDAGVAVVGDIELFARAANAPIVAITGSNAKTTVTTLLGLMADTAGIKVAVGGNIGTPALDLLNFHEVDLYVLELSSFQLETTKKLNAKVATILNVSADHMDRYQGLPQYHAAKQRIYFGAEQIVFNRADVLTQPPVIDSVKRISFGLQGSDFGQFGILEKAGVAYLSWQFEALMPVSELKIKGSHNIQNVLAALALGQAVDIPMVAMLTVLKSFPGLPHRCQWVESINGVDFYNDSKGTNVGATLAALEGLSCSVEKFILIAGGVGKAADFSELTQMLGKTCRALIVIGEAAEQLASIAPKNILLIYAASLAAALQQSCQLACRGDAVLLSPACASFDMFTGFEDRGEQFIQWVQQAALEYRQERHDE